MRDDIHKKAPISRVLQSVLKHALLPADQARPYLLIDLAVRALTMELRAQVTPTLRSALQAQAEAPLLFQGMDANVPALSRLQADVAAYSGADIQVAMERGARDHVRVLCNETLAALIAADRDRARIQAGVEAFNAALLSAIPRAVVACLDPDSTSVSNRKVTLDEALPLGSRAKGGPR